MPLYTYVVSYKGRSHALQLKRSNFQGFYEWIREIPNSIIPESKQSELAGKIIRVQFEPVANRHNVWSKSIELDNEPFTVFAIQTEQ